MHQPLAQRIRHDIVNHCTPKSNGLVSPRYASVTFLNPSRSRGSASPPPLLRVACSGFERPSVFSQILDQYVPLSPTTLISYHRILVPHCRELNATDKRGKVEDERRETPYSGRMADDRVQPGPPERFTPRLQYDANSL